MKKYEEMSIKNLVIKGENIRKAATITGLLCGLESIAMPIPEAKFMITGGAFAYLAMSLSKDIAIDASLDNNKEYLEFKRIYSEILDNMVKLTKNLDNKTVMEHYTLYRGLLDDHMLSCSSSDNSFHELYYEPFVAPEYTLNGHGVCRNQAAMGCDFYSKLGYENHFQPCYSSVDPSCLPMIDSITAILEKAILEGEKKGDNVHVDLIKGFLEEVRDTKANMIAERLSKKKKHNNHVVIKVNDSNNTYFLDTMQKTFYTSSDKPDIFCNMAGERIETGIQSRKKKRYEKLSPNITTHNVPSIGKLRDEFKKCIHKYKDNYDMIEKFNKENKDRLERAEEIYTRSLRK